MDMTEGPFTGRGEKITGKQQGGRPPKFTPGEYYVRVRKGVHTKSQRGHGSYGGIECTVVKAVTSYTREENAPYGPSIRVGQTAGWVFPLHIGNDTKEYLAQGNLNNIAEALMATEGFEDCLTPAQREQLKGLILAEQSGDESADPSGAVVNLMVMNGGETFGGLPVRIKARDARGQGSQWLFCACDVHPVSAEELAEHYED